MFVKSKSCSSFSLALADSSQQFKILSSSPGILQGPFKNPQEKSRNIARTFDAEIKGK